jgi:MFS family permease
MADIGATPEPAAAPPIPSTHDPYAVLRNRDLAFYLVARFMASIGQQMLTVAVGWEIYERTNRCLALGLIGLTQMLPMVLFTLPAGHAADTYNRKRIIISMTFVLALASIALTFISAFQAPDVWIYACLFVAGVARTFLWPASSAFLPHLVARDDFSKAVTWSSGSFQLSSVLGPAAGGAVIAFTHHLTGGHAASAAPVYGLNALLSLVCLVLIGFVRRSHVVAVKEKMTARSLVVGFNFVFANPVILGTITLDLFAVLLGGATALLPVYAKDILHSGPTGLGLLQAALPLGSLVCALMLAHRPPMQKAGRTLLWSVAVFGLATIVFGVSRVFWLSLLMLFVCGFVDNVSVVVRHTVVQLLTPDEKRGRVSAVNSLFIGTSNELGGFESGLVANWFGPIASVVSGGIGTILVVLVVALAWPQIRKYGRLDGG